MMRIGKCAICGEELYSWEATETIIIDNKKYIIHNRPGCKEALQHLFGGNIDCLKK